MSLMYSRKIAGPRMDPWETPALTAYSYEDFPSRTTWRRLLLRKKIKAKYLSWNSIRLNFVKKTSIPNPVKSSPRPAKSPSNSIRHNYQKIRSWSRRPKTIRKIRGDFCRWSTILLFTSFSKALLTTERRLQGVSF